MASYTLDSNHIPKYLLLLLYLITGTLSNFGAIDILAPQWIYLCVINILSCLYFLFFSPNRLGTGATKFFSSSYFLLYLFYILWNLCSYFYAINPTETLINLPRLANTFFAIFFSFFLLYSLPNKIYFVVRLFLAFLVVELAVYFNDFITLSTQEGFNVMNVKGFAGNKNITAASIAFKLSLIFYLLFTAKKIIYRIFYAFILFSGFLAISLIEARSAILSTLIVLFLCFSYLLYLVVSRQLSLRLGLIKSSFLLVPISAAFIFNISLTNVTKRDSITSTVGDISFTEQSSNGRFGYWSDAFDYVTKNPILASGLGNWKIASISEGKEHINGYTVPYHAHNDFIHVFAETGILGGISYIGIFVILTFYLFLLARSQYKEQTKLKIEYFSLFLPLVVYGIDAGLNFPVARPLMQSSLALLSGLILALYFTSIYQDKFKIRNAQQVFVLGLVFLMLIPSLTIHFLSYISLKKQGLLLYEFNNAKFNMTRAQLDEISHDFPNLTETAMPIKSMKARYYYLQGNKQEAYEMIDEGAKDNPQIYFSENLKSQFLFNEGKVDSAYFYAKKAFFGLPNNMPHYDMYMKTLVAKKEYSEIDEAFSIVNKLGGDTVTIWTIYIRSLAQTRGLGDPFAMEKAATAYRLFPDNETIFTLYRILTYGQQRLVEAEELNKKATDAYNSKDFSNASALFKAAYDKDPLQYSYSLNTGLSFYEGRNFEESVKYFDLSNNSKKSSIKEKALRYKGLALLQLNRRPEACAIFLKLKNNYPKRMYQQEFTKYCIN